MRRIVDEAYREVSTLLRENRDRLDSLATALLEHETLDQEDAYAAAGVQRGRMPGSSAGPATAAAVIATSDDG